MELIENNKKVHLDISMAAEYKIRALCSMLPNREWSGVLFYEVEGGFEDLNYMKLHVKDFMTLDIGSNVFTEFEVTPDVCAYMVDNNLLDCQTGLIHSHNTMSTFFSGVDRDTLLKKGSQQTHFLSLIVNNAGEYSAAITAQVKYPTRVKQAYMVTYGDREIEKSFSEKEEKAVMYFEAYIVPNEYLEPVKAEVKAILDRKVFPKESPLFSTSTPDHDEDKDRDVEEEELDMEYFTYNEILKTMFSAEVPKSHVKDYSVAAAFKDFCGICGKISVDDFEDTLEQLYVNTAFGDNEYCQALNTLESVRVILEKSTDKEIPEKNVYYPYYRRIVALMEDMAENDLTEKMFKTYVETGKI